MQLLQTERRVQLHRIEPRQRPVKQATHLSTQGGVRAKGGRVRCGSGGGRVGRGRFGHSARRMGSSGQADDTHWPLCSSHASGPAPSRCLPGRRRCGPSRRRLPRSTRRWSPSRTAWPAQLEAAAAPADRAGRRRTARATARPPRGTVGRTAPCRSSALAGASASPPGRPAGTEWQRPAPEAPASPGGRRAHRRRRPGRPRRAPACGSAPPRAPPRCSARRRADWPHAAVL
eukprot:scaffold7544_cov107-Isochrysis_galbana.AAC.1